MSNHNVLPDERPNEPANPVAIGSMLREPSASVNPAAQISRLFSTVLRYKWIVVAAGVVGAVAGVFAGRMVKPSFVAQGTLWIEDSKRGESGPIMADRLLPSSAWIELLKTYKVLDPVVKSQKLYVRASGFEWAFQDIELADRMVPGSYNLAVTPDRKGWILATNDGQEIERGPIGTAVGSKVGFRWLPPPEALQSADALPFTLIDPRDVSRNLAAAILPSMAQDGRFLRLSYIGSTPAELAATLNAVMTQFVDVALEVKRAKLDELTSILEEQKDYAEKNVKAAEFALQEFRVNTVTMPTTGAPVPSGILETRSPVITRFFEMKIDLEDQRSDRATLESVLQNAASGPLKVEALTVIQSVQSSPVLQQMLKELNEARANLRALQAKYTDEYEPVRERLAAVTALEKVQIPGALRDLLQQLVSQENELSGRIALAAGEIQQIPPRMIEEKRLERRVEIANRIYIELRQNYETARLAAVSSIPDVAVLDQARVPSEPVANQKTIVMAGFFLGSVGLAVMIILLLNHTDRRVRYPEQITAGLGLPILGAIPRVRGGLTEQDSNGAIQLGEAFRELRLSVVHAHGAAGPLVLSVTSAEAGDGKSTVAGSLARIFADQGHQVLLIDGDIRRGDLHRSLGLSRSPGLTDFLDGRANLDEILQVCTDRGFTLIGSGTRMQKGPELLGSPAMAHLIRSLRSRFAVIIVDTPPLGAGVDAYILSTITGNMVMVVRTGRTDGDLAEAKLSLLDRLPVRVLGAVLNDVPPSRLYRQYSYLSGYEAEDENVAVVAALQAAGVVAEVEAGAR